MRYWRILLIEDQSYDLKNEINKMLCEEINTYFDKNFGKRFIGESSETWNNEDAFPLTIDNLTEAWFSLQKLHAEKEKPDISFVDIKLDTKKSKDSESHLEAIKSEITRRLWTLNSFRDQTDIRVILEEKLFKKKDNVYGIQDRGGIYLASLLKLLFPYLPTYLYTESKDAFSDSIPFLMADMYTILYGGKFLLKGSDSPNPQFQWHNILKKQMIQKITSGRVLLERIKEALNTFKEYVFKLKDNMSKYYASEEVKQNMYNFLMTDIGSSNEPGWTISSFFVLFVENFQIKSFERTKEGITKIEEILASIEYDRMFGKFILSSHFNAYSHANSQVFKGGDAEGYTPIAARDKKLLENAAQEMQKQWGKLPCKSSLAVEGFYNDYIKEAVNLGNFAVNTFFKKCEDYKDSARVNLEGITKQMEMALNTSSCGNHLQCEYFIFSKKNGKYVETSNNEEYGAKKNKMGFFGTPEGYLPLNSSGDMNMLGDLIKTILQSIFKNGYMSNENTENKVNILIKLDEITSEWKITIIQQSGKPFSKKDIDDGKFFEEKSHDLRDAIRSVKNWIRIKINSNGVSRDPHTENLVQMSQIDGTVQYELSISLAGE